jgi:hypothetical protein
LLTVLHEWLLPEFLDLLNILLLLIISVKKLNISNFLYFTW